MLSLKLFSKRVPDIKILITREMHKNKSYYDALGLTPKASKEDIKKAYYKMSMVYHPDKGEGDAERFREITAAYEVLGNTKLRRMYDHGVIRDPGWSSSTTSQENYEEFARGGQNSDEFKKNKTYTGKTEHYNYDAWTKAHYSETFERRQNSYRRATRERDELLRRQLEKADKIATTAFVCVVMTMVLYVSYALDNDRPRFASYSNYPKEK